MTVFGPLNAAIDIEKAALKTLEEWMPSYLAEIERQKGLTNKALGRPPAPESYHGGLDFLSVKDDQLPEVIVICNPAGEPERMTEEVIQGFQTEIGCVIKSEEGALPEAIARRNASYFSLAAQGIVMQHESLGLAGTVLETPVLTGSPRVEFLEPENRRYAVGIVTFLIYAQTIEWKAGPTELKTVEPEEAYPEPAEIKKETITIKAESVSEAIH